MIRAIGAERKRGIDPSSIEGPGVPRCSWCGEFTRDAQRLEDGRAVLTLCPLCAAEKRLRDNPELSPRDLSRPPSLWERIRRFFRGRRGRE